MRTRTIITTATAALAITLVGCSSTNASKSSATSRATTIVDGSEAVGLPPKPDASAARKAYLAALNAIDPRIAKPGKDDQTISRGLSQCASIKSLPNDEDKLSRLALDRFTITTRLPDIATPQTGAKITAAVHKHLCPNF